MGKTAGGLEITFLIGLAFLTALRMKFNFRKLKMSAHLLKLHICRKIDCWHAF